MRRISPTSLHFLLRRHAHFGMLAQVDVERSGAAFLGAGNDEVDLVARRGAASLSCFALFYGWHGGPLDDAPHRWRAQ